MFFHSFKKFVLSSFFLFSLALVSSAQELPLQQRFINEFTRPGRPTMTVSLWGSVAYPGVWNVERDVDLIDLLSAAQIPGAGVVEPDVRQQAVIKLYRPVNGERREIYRADLEQLLGEGQSYPTLANGDIVEVVLVRRRRVGFQFVTQIVGTSATLTLLVLRITQGR